MSSRRIVCLLIFYIKDPMTDEWDPLDAELLEHLSTRKWTSMAIERYLKSPSFQQKLDMGSAKYKFALDYMYGSEESGDFNKRRGETNVFQAGMPGAMTITEIQEKVSLGHWRLRIGDRIVLLEVGTHPLLIPNCPTIIIFAGFGQLGRRRHIRARNSQMHGCRACCMYRTQAGCGDNTKI